MNNALQKGVVLPVRLLRDYVKSQMIVIIVAMISV